VDVSRRGTDNWRTLMSTHAYDDSNGALVDHFDFEDFSLVVHN
jgi:hypothetical protein